MEEGGAKRGGAARGGGGEELGRRNAGGRRNEGRRRAGRQEGAGADVFELPFVVGVQGWFGARGRMCPFPHKGCAEVEMARRAGGCASRGWRRSFHVRDLLSLSFSCPRKAAVRAAHALRGSVRAALLSRKDLQRRRNAFTTKRVPPYRSVEGMHRYGNGDVRFRIEV